MYEITFRAMGSQMKAVVDAESDAAPETLRQVLGWFEEWERILSRFRPESELSQLNARPGEWIRVSGTLCEVLGESMRAASLTGGLVDPTLLTALESAGYVRSFEELDMLDLRRSTITPGTPAGSWMAIGLDSSRKKVRVPIGARLDLGGVAKGWAAERAVERLAQIGPALVDAGGDIAVRGPGQGRDPWQVAIASPVRETEEPIGLIKLSNGFIATSGRDYRRWQVGDRWVHHIIDPRTGRSAQTDAVSATVVGSLAWTTEAAAKAALILGGEKGIAWLENQPELEGLIVMENAGLLMSSGFDKLVGPSRG